MEFLGKSCHSLVVGFAVDSTAKTTTRERQLFPSFCCWFNSKNINKGATTLSQFLLLIQQQKQHQGSDNSFPGYLVRFSFPVFLSWTWVRLYGCLVIVLLSKNENENVEQFCKICWLCNSYTMVCPPVCGDNPRALANWLSYVQVVNHDITILCHLHQCRPWTSRDISF